MKSPCGIAKFESKHYAELLDKPFCPILQCDVTSQKFIIISKNVLRSTQSSKAVKSYYHCFHGTCKSVTSCIVCETDRLISNLLPDN